MKNLITKKYRSIFTATTLGMIVEYILLLSDNIIAGQMLGEQSLAALSLIFPFVNFAFFLTYFLSYGVTICTSQEIGRMNRKRANELFSNGAILCVICGGFCSLAALLFKTEILSALNIPEEIYGDASSYFSYILWFPLLAPVCDLLYGMIIIEGNEKLATIASIVQMVSNVVLSIILCLWIGIAGIAIGTLVSVVLALGIYSLHFFRKDNEVRFIFRISWKDFSATAKYGFSDSSHYLYSFISFSILNSYIALNYGTEALVAFCVIMNIQSFIIIILDGVGSAMQPLIGVFYGEKNMLGVERVLRVTMKYALLTSAAICATLYLFGRPIEWIMGLNEGPAAEYALMGIYILAPASFLFAVLQVLTAYFVSSEKLKATIYMNTMLHLVFLLALTLSLEKWMGISGIWLGMLLAPVGTLLFALPSLKLIYKKGTLPLFIDKEETKNWNYDTGNTDPQSFMAMVAETELFLREKNVPNKAVMQAILLVEEMCIAIREKNKLNVVNIDCCVHVEEGVVLIFRDDGQSVDLSEVDSAVSSLQDFLTSSILESYSSRNYMHTTGFNRSSFYIPFAK